MSGLLIAVEGPNGSGKSTVCDALRTALGTGARVVWTTEPTRTAFGLAVRAAEETLRGRAYALAIAADRTDHLDREVVPALHRGAHAVTDRYVQSSLVLQQLDGLSVEQIWAYNDHLRPADITFYLEVDVDVLRARLAGRARLSRIERSYDSARETHFYAGARRFLDERGWRQETVECGQMAASEVAARVVTRLQSLFPSAGFHGADGAVRPGEPVND